MHIWGPKNMSLTMWQPKPNDRSQLLSPPILTIHLNKINFNIILRSPLLYQLHFSDSFSLHFSAFDTASVFLVRTSHCRLGFFLNDYLKFQTHFNIHHTKITPVKLFYATSYHTGLKKPKILHVNYSSFPYYVTFSHLATLLRDIYVRVILSYSL